jgi:hypothetical protein
MISHSKKFVFIHIFKVAGTSVRAILTPYCDQLNPSKRFANKISHRIIRRPLFIPYSPSLHGHAKAMEYRDFLGSDTFGRYFKFAFVRNPYDWQVSLYEYIRQTQHHRQHLHVSGMTFDAYIRWRCAEERILQVDFLRDDEQNMIVDFVGKFEMLNEDFQRVTRRIGIEGSLPWLNKTKRNGCTEYYTPETKALIDDAFDEDFKRLDYEKKL